MSGQGKPANLMGEQAALCTASAACSSAMRAAALCTAGAVMAQVSWTGMTRSQNLRSITSDDSKLGTESGLVASMHDMISE